MAETGNLTLPLFTTQPGTTFDLTNLSGLSFGAGEPIDFTATGGSIVTQTATFLNVSYNGTASAQALMTQRARSTSRSPTILGL